MTRFCPHCWAENLPDGAVCANCGQSPEAEGDYLSKLVAALHHPEPATPRRAAWILGELRDPRAVQPLLRVLEESQDPYLLADAVEALGKIGDLGSVTALGRLLRTSFLLVRLRAVEALGRIGDLEAENALRRALNDPSRAVRARAREVLLDMEEEVRRRSGDRA